jgi:hypothetical protein
VKKLSLALVLLAFLAPLAVQANVLERSIFIPGSELLESGVEAAGKGLTSFSRAGEFGIKPYNVLTGELKGTGLQAHHLIEQRFATALGVDARTMQSMALTPAEHQVFTNAWRAEIGYGAGTAAATRESVMAAAQKIYSGYPEILKALGF